MSLDTTAKIGFRAEAAEGTDPISSADTDPLGGSINFDLKTDLNLYAIKHTPETSFEVYNNGNHYICSLYRLS